MAAFSTEALLINTSAVSFWYSPITTGTLCLIIPAFCAAIKGRVSPKISIWSQPILVITERSGVIMLVESNLPPRPTSIIAISTCSRAKISKANATVISKNEGLIFSKLALWFSTKVITSVSLIIAPFIRIRSLKSFRCGDVYRPVLYPAVCRMAANICEVEPFPFVPAICMPLNLF